MAGPSNRRVSNRTWGLLASIGLTVLGIGGLPTLLGSQPIDWIRVVSFAVGFGGLVDLCRRWHEI